MCSFLARLLALIAIMGFISTPIMAPPAWAANTYALSDTMPGHKAQPLKTTVADATFMVGMDCCPQQEETSVGCPKTCPWAALCVAKCFSSGVPLSGFTLALSSRVIKIALGDDLRVDRLNEPPRPRPPRT